MSTPGGDKEDDVWLAATVAPIRNDDLARPLFCYIANDISERKRAEEAIRLSGIRAEALARAAANLSAHFADPEAVMHVVCEEASRALNIPTVVAYLCDERTQTLVPAVAYGDPRKRHRYRIPLSGLVMSELCASPPESDGVIVVDLSRIRDLPGAPARLPAGVHKLALAKPFSRQQVLAISDLLLHGPPAT